MANECWSFDANVSLAIDARFRGVDDFEFSVARPVASVRDRTEHDPRRF